MPRDEQALAKRLPPRQLYNMVEDIGERKNRFPGDRKKVAELKELLEKQVAAGRSTPGPEQTNDAEVDIKKPSVRRKGRATSRKARK